MKTSFIERPARAGMFQGAVGAVLTLWGMAAPARSQAADAVDFRYAPPEWQTSICLPDDPNKSLVDRHGKLLYHYGEGGREFATTVAVEVASNVVWQKQELESPRIPIVRTSFAGDGWQVLEEAFAVTGLPQAKARQAPLLRLDGNVVNRQWDHPGPGVAASLGDAATHYNGSLHFQAAGKSRRIALALCEGWWNQPGKRMEVLRVEGAEPRTVDLVADIGRNKAAIFWFDAKDMNGDGQIDIEVEAADKAGDKNTVLNGLWVFPADATPDEASLLAGQPVGALAQLDQAVVNGPSRNDLMLVHVTNTGGAPRAYAPTLVADTALGLQLNDQQVVVNHRETITSSLKFTGQASGGRLQLESVTVAPGETARFYVLYSDGGKILLTPDNLGAALDAHKRAVKYWQDAPLPYGRIQVPDPEIQALIDASIRNIWQARDIKKGVPVFQVGPTCYRGLWIVDGSFLLEAATMLGADKEARNGIAYTLGLQKPSGAFEVLCPEFYKENGIVLWTCTRHAWLTQDKAWLNSVWPKLERTAAYIKTLRQRSLDDASPLDDGLNPPGEIDGGLWGAATHFTRPEFSNVHWNLAGLRALVQAAQWLGKTDEAAQWKKEYDDLYATFRKAAARDSLSDSHGHPYTPIFMANAGKELPQRAQWTFCHAVYPGQIFSQDDPMVAGTLAMLEATEREGMVYGTGWEANGIWNYFASFYGHAWLWEGNGRKAAQVLYAYANHASPLLAWREEQSLAGQPFKQVGDMPHNWASAEFIRLTTHLLELDRGQELHLFEGLPAQWAKPGMVTRLQGIATPFGKLTMELAVAADGKTAQLHVEPLSDPACRKLVAHLTGWASDQKNDVIELDPRSRNDRTIALASGTQHAEAP